MKDHHIREFVNTLRDVAIQFHNHGSLRDRLSSVVQNFLDAHNKNVIIASKRSDEVPNNKEDV